MSATLLAINRLLAPRSELYTHEKWFDQTAMNLLLNSDAAVAAKDRLWRCLDRLRRRGIWARKTVRR